MRKLLTIIGARPQFIKASALSRVLLDERWGIQEEVLHTGQHHDEAMSAVFFKELGMHAPQHKLHLQSSKMADRMGEMMAGIGAVVEQIQPDAMLVYGDTDSTWAGAWVASRFGIPLAHVEAGLRSYDRSMPEEVNRVLTDHVANWLFCPTDEALKNLAREGIREGIIRTGDLQWDTATWMAQQSEQLSPAEGALLTLHRPSNVDDERRLRAWVEAIENLNQRVFFPVHPRTAAACQRIWGANWSTHLKDRGFHVSGPLGYQALIDRIRSVRAVITDSGGLQKEAYGFQKPCIVVRPVTEWVELVEVGAVRLCENPADLAGAWKWVRNAPSPPVGLYGEGQAAIEIAQALSETSWR
jgi:UDP-GlcNAc3NAcA epimerase